MWNSNYISECLECFLWNPNNMTWKPSDNLYYTWSLYFLCILMHDMWCISGDKTDTARGIAWWWWDSSLPGEASCFDSFGSLTNMGTSWNRRRQQLFSLFQSFVSIVCSFVSIICFNLFWLQWEVRVLCIWHDSAMAVCLVPVSFVVSGETVAVLDAAEFEGLSAQALKQSLARLLGISRFRQRIFTIFTLSDMLLEIQDHEVLTSLSQLKIQLLVLEFLPADDKEDRQMVLASNNNDFVSLEGSLQHPRTPNVIDEEGNTPLHYTAKNGHVESTQLLLEAGAEKDAIDFSMMTPLHWATSNSHLAVVHLLIEARADRNPAMQGGKTPLHLAVEKDNLEVAQLLLEARANQNQTENGGQTPLHLAAEKGHVGLVRLLIGAGAQKDLTEKNERTPLHFAAKMGHLDVVRLLVEAGAEKDLRGPLRQTPLHLAAENGYLDVVRLLVEARANIDLAGKRGKSPLDCADTQGQVDVVQFLIDADAKRHDFKVFGGSGIDLLAAARKAFAQCFRANRRLPIVKPGGPSAVRYSQDPMLLELEWDERWKTRASGAWW